VNCSNVVALPGANGSASRACRARDNSPSRVSWAASCALWLLDGPCGAVVVSGSCWGHGWLAWHAWSNCPQCPEKKAVNLLSNCAFGILDGPARLVEQHAGQENLKFPCSVSAAGVCRIWSNAKCNALRSGPRKKGGGERNVWQGWAKNSSTEYWSRQAKAMRRQEP
jgi:hypothetical protein